MIPGCTTQRKNGRHANYNVEDDGYLDDNIRPIRKHRVVANVSLPIVWLMSFPASNEWLVVYIILMEQQIPLNAHFHHSSPFSFLR